MGHWQQVLHSPLRRGSQPDDVPLQLFLCGMPDTYIKVFVWSAAHGGELFGVLSCEIGGGNGLESLALGARLGLPVVDADLMGRAFPELQVRERIPLAC